MGRKFILNVDDARRRGQQKANARCLAFARWRALRSERRVTVKVQ